MKEIKKNTITVLDTILLVLALFFTILVIRKRAYNLANNDIIGKNISYLSWSISLVLLIFQFKALRKTTVYLCWTGISAILLCMYFWLYNDSSLNYLDKAGDTFNYAHGLAGPFFILIFYQICRQLSLKYYKVELGLPSRVADNILEEKRKSTWLDILCLIGFIGIPLATYYF